MRSGGGRRWPFAVAIVGVAAVVAAVAFVVLATRSDPAPPVAVKKASYDSEAPPRAPAHWLAPEDWIYNHWLPYDEGRLHALLGVTRGDIWRQLRDDRRNLAQLAAKHGWPDAGKLADALVAPRAGDVTAAQLALLRSRAERTITQGHLAQHLFFHSLHQFAIPSAAPEIFGVTDAEFRVLRRGEQSPLEIGRLNGRSPALIERLSAGVLRERADFGVATGAMTARQARLLLRRQLSQLPRWLAQVRYNGPPTTHAGKLTRAPRDFAANPALTSDGARVAFEAYVQKLPRALKDGEINVHVRRVAGGPPRNVSLHPERRAPRSAYNPSISGDGRVVAFEAAAGNLNFAKRYGEIRVFVTDTRSGATQTMPLPRARPGVSRSAYNPVLAANGRAVAYQAQAGGGASAVYVADVRTRRMTLAGRGAGAGVYDPAISGDGTKVAFTTSAPNFGALRGRTQVFVRDLRAGTTTLVSRANGRGGAIANDYSADPALSRDGRYVAFSSAATNLGARGARGGSQIYVRDLRTQATYAVSSGPGFALKPSISAGGRTVAYTSIVGGRARVVVRDGRGRGPQRLVSRASGARGAPADASSSDAAISADGRRVAFTSAATNLAAGKPDDRRGVFVRDLRTQATTLLSAPVEPAAAVQSSAAQVAAASRAAAGGSRPDGAPVVSILDNAFRLGADRPTIRLRSGATLTWRWLSQQSHQVTLRSGPLSLPASPTRTDGRFTARLTAPGTYEFVCSIHAPGMRMRAVVRE